MHWAEQANERLSAAGFRAGAARRQVIDLLAAQSCALTALEIDRRLPAVGRASVYRTLEQLEQLGLLNRVDVGSEVVAFERNDPGGHHHHMLCTKCGRLLPFSDPSLEQAIAAIGAAAEFQITSHDVLLRGLCPQCAEAKS
jgi:Fur family transcriptional regulator, ferric uptake regulator